MTGEPEVTAAQIKDARERPVTLSEMIWECDRETERTAIANRCHARPHLDYIRREAVFAAITRFLLKLEPEMPAICEMFRKKRSA